jgi:hypothetical protein
MHVCCFTKHKHTHAQEHHKIQDNPPTHIIANKLIDLSSSAGGGAIGSDGIHAWFYGGVSAEVTSMHTGKSRMHNTNALLLPRAAQQL